MVPRIVIAFIGGSAITVGLLLGMTQATKNFKTMDPMRYFDIVDFLPVAPGSRRVQPPPTAAAPPDLPRLRYERSLDPTLPFEQPSVDSEPLTPPVVPPDLEPAAKHR